MYARVYVYVSVFVYVRACMCICLCSCARVRACMHTRKPLWRARRTTISFPSSQRPGDVEFICRTNKQINKHRYVHLLIKVKVK